MNYEMTVKKNKIEYKSKSIIDKLFSIAVLILLVISKNPDWNNQLTWWGSVAFFVIITLIKNNFKMFFKKKYALWFLSFYLICFFSCIWSVNLSLTLETLKSLTIYFVLLLLLCSAIKKHDDIKRIVFLILISTLINSLYLLIANLSTMLGVNGTNGVIDRLGTGEGWNANGVGIMTSIGGMIACYFFSVTKNVKWKTFFMISMIVETLVTVLTGSRTALIMILFGLSLFMFLSSKGRRGKIVFTILVSLLIFYYVVMYVPFFHSIIGWRIEGLWSLIAGGGEVDGSASMRDLLIKDALEKWLERPILGYGLNCYLDVNSINNLYAHNNFAELLADLGLVGFIIYYSAFIYVIFKFLSKKKKEKIDWLFIAFAFVILLSDYGTVSFANFFILILVMIMFVRIDIPRRQA